VTTSLAQLRTPLTADELRARIISGLQAAGFPTSDWATTKQGGLENGTVDMAAGTLADLQGQKLADAISGGFLDFAVDEWMTFLARRYYKLDRSLATFTIQQLQLVCAPTAGPYTINAGELVVTGPTGNHYRNLEGASLAQGGGVLMQVQAEEAGASFADPIDTLTTLVTSLPGVTVTNPRSMVPTPAALVNGTGSTGLIVPLPPLFPTAILADTFRLRIEGSGQVGTALYSISTDNGKTYSEPLLLQPSQEIPGGAFVIAEEDPTNSLSFRQGDVFFWAATSILQQGADEESDARMAARCRARWLTLSDVPTSGTVALWARQAAPEVVRVKVVSEPSAANRMLVYISGSAGPAAPLTVVTVQQYITARLTPPEGATVLPVDLRRVSPSGTVVAPRGALAQVQAQADLNWLAYLASVDIGGTIRLAELQQAVMDAGATNFSGLSIGGSPNVVMGGTEVPLAVSSLTSLLSWQAA
jgi:hypothetical protein